MCDFCVHYFVSISNGIPAARSPLTELLEGRWCLSIGTSEWPVEEQNAQWFGSFPKKLFKNDMQQNQTRVPFPTFPNQRSWLLAQRIRINRPIGSEIGWHLSHIYVPPTRYIVKWTSLVITSHAQQLCWTMLSAEISTCPIERHRNCLEQTIVDIFPKCPNGDS